MGREIHILVLYFHYKTLPNKESHEVRLREIVKVKVSHSLIAVGAAWVRVLLYLGHS